MKWYFSSNDGGQESGIHDAGIETFEGDFYYSLARELIQNSLDARHDFNKPVRIRFNVEEIPLSEIPDANGLANAQQRCAEYWQKMKKAKDFFENANTLMGKPTIPILRIGDYNTTGICGSDSDREKNWYNLIRCSGSSSKGSGEGGSYGIGKNAPFVISKLRTILYSTKTFEGDFAFQGVAKLVTHQHIEEGLAQATGYLGGHKGTAIRNESEIPHCFRRKHLGTDIIILGFKYEKNWKEELVYSILHNFWPAIHFADLEVEVDDISISKNNLETYLNDYAQKEKERFTAHHFFRAYTNPSEEFHQERPILGKIDLYLYMGEQDLPKKVAMIRKTGMVIYLKQFRSPLPFCGVFLCRNEQGNNRLRDMEPPRHDDWDSDHPEKGANKKTEQEFISFIREGIKRLKPADDSKTIDIPGLYRFLPDDTESPEQAFDEYNYGDHKEEAPNKHPKSQRLSEKIIEMRRKPIQPAPTKVGIELESAEEAGRENFEDDGYSALDGFPNTAGDKKIELDRSGEKGGKRSLPISYRTFARNLNAGVYVAIISSASDESKKAILRIKQSCDDGNNVPLEVKQARTTFGEQLSIRGNAIGPVMLGGSALKMEILLTQPIRVAMEVEAHEAE